MTAAKIALLEDRGVIAVTGEDAGKFLQGLITNDVDAVGDQGAVFAALLSPQGKILFDFFVVEAADGYLLDVARDQAETLVKRLTMYKLRAKVAISVHPAIKVEANWAGAPRDGWSDPRSRALGGRGFSEGISQRCNTTSANFHADRIALGIPEGGKDYAWGEVFPHEANMDQLNGVSFTKGCYVGQEIVARMEHRGTARRRIVRVQGHAPLPPVGTEIRAGDVAIGTMGSSAGNNGLAMLRLDRVVEFAAQGVPLMCSGVTLIPDADDIARLMPPTVSTPS